MVSWSQMTSRCGKNNKVAHVTIAECATDVLTTFWRPLWSITEQTHGNMESICFIQLNKHTSSAFHFKNFLTRKPAFAHFGKHEKKPFDVICCLYKMKQSHWLLCITRNCDWSRKIAPLSNLTQMFTAKAELNCEICKCLKKIREESTEFLSSEQPCGPKNFFFLYFNNFY